MDAELPIKGIDGELKTVVLFYSLCLECARRARDARHSSPGLSGMLGTKNSISTSVGTQPKYLINAWAIHTTTLFSFYHALLIMYIRIIMHTSTPTSMRFHIDKQTIAGNQKYKTVSWLGYSLKVSIPC